jgi:hypothetical protein
MPGLAAVETEDRNDQMAIERMLDDGAPVPRLRRTVRLVREPHVPSIVSPEERVAQRRATRRLFRAYCVACARSTESSSVPALAGRCAHCGGTMLVEVVAD